jgi:hypothetical protein
LKERAEAQTGTGQPQQAPPQTEDYEPARR